MKRLQTMKPAIPFKEPREASGLFFILSFGMGEHIHHFRFYSKQTESAKIAVGKQQLLCNKMKNS
jgi:hypothetical protein